MNTDFHSLRAQLYDNALTEDPNDFVARIISERSLGISNICASAVSRGGADISAAAMEHGVNIFLKEMAYQLCDGYSINTGYFTAIPLIKGVFNSPNETFNKEKHSISFDFSQGSLLRKELENITVNILGVADASLSIAQVTDVKTGSINEIITPNRNLKISGSKLKIVGDNEAVGIYFISQDTEERTKVDASDIVTNNPSELVILSPSLPAGAYKVEVCSQYSTGGNLLKEPKRTVFNKILTVL